MEVRNMAAVAALGALMGSGIGSPDYPRREVEIDPDTGKQPIAKPQSKRQAALLAKALRRQERR